MVKGIVSLDEFIRKDVNKERLPINRVCSASVKHSWLCLIQPHTRVAKKWLKENCQYEPWQITKTGGILVECIQDADELVDAMRTHGLEVVFEPGRTEEEEPDTPTEFVMGVELDPATGELRDKVNPNYPSPTPENPREVK